MGLEYILQNAALSIEALKDYYFSQIDKIAKEVDKKCIKFVPGAMIDRYLFAKASKQEQLLSGEMGTKVTELAEKLLRDVTIIEREIGYSIAYKLDEKYENNPKYEMDPKKAAREYRKLNERIEILNNSTLILLLIKYEETIAGIF